MGAGVTMRVETRAWYLCGRSLGWEKEGAWAGKRKEVFTGHVKLGKLPTCESEAKLSLVPRALAHGRRGGE